MVLIKSCLNSKILPKLSSQQCFSILKAMMNNTEVCQNDRLFQQIGYLIFNLLKTDVRRMLNNEAYYLVSRDRICLIPCYNFLQFFQNRVQVYICGSFRMLKKTSGDVPQHELSQAGANNPVRVALLPAPL